MDGSRDEEMERHKDRLVERGEEEMGKESWGDRSDEEGWRM